jgi:hypothetical protein
VLVPNVQPAHTVLLLAQMITGTQAFEATTVTVKQQVALLLQQSVAVQHTSVDEFGANVLPDGGEQTTTGGLVQQALVAGGA